MKQVLLVAIAVVLSGTFAFAQASAPAMPQSSSSAQAGQGQGGSDEQQILALEQQWANAMKSGDASAVQRIEADDYVFTDPTGRVSNKMDDVNSVQSGQAKYQKFDLSDMQVHVSGDTAVVTGHVDIQGTDHGQDISGKYAFTDTFAKRNGQWVAVATESTKLQPASQQQRPPQ